MVARKEWRAAQKANPLSYLNGFWDDFEDKIGWGGDDYENHDDGEISNDEEFSDDEVTISCDNEVSKREGSENSENNERDQRTDARLSGAARDALDVLADLAAERLL